MFGETAIIHLELVGIDRPSTIPHSTYHSETTPANQLETVIRIWSSGFESAIAGALTFSSCPEIPERLKIIGECSLPVAELDTDKHFFFVYN